MINKYIKYIEYKNEIVLDQKYHLLYRPTACTSWKVLDLDDKDNRQKHQKGTLLQIIYQKGTLLQLFLGGGGGLFFNCKAPPTQAPPLCTWHVAQGGSAPDAGAFSSAQGSDTTGGAPAAGATASAGQPPSLFF